MVKKVKNKKPYKWALEIARVLTPLLSRMHDNLRRTQHLVSIYNDLYGKGKGRRVVHKADLLRAAVVFLHATLEDFLRSVATLYLPTASEETLNRVAGELQFVAENQRFGPLAPDGVLPYARGVINNSPGAGAQGHRRVRSLKHSPTLA